MTLPEYFLLYGKEGLEKLAEEAGTKVSYLMQLMYLPELKEPSLTLAVRIVKASGNKITYESLARGARVDHTVIRRRSRAQRSQDLT